MSRQFRNTSSIVIRPLPGQDCEWVDSHGLRQRGTVTGLTAGGTKAVVKVRGQKRERILEMHRLHKVGR